MENETRGQEDAAQDAAACAEALESLDRFSLDEVAFDETIADMQDAAGDGIQDTGDDVEDARDEADVEKGDDEGNGQPEPNAGDETSLLGDLPVDESLTRELPGLGSAPVVDETVRSLGTRSRGSSS